MNSTPPRRSAACAGLTPGPGRPVALPPETRRTRIFEALEAVYTDTGLDGASMDAIARRAGMSKRTLYAMFSGRDDLLHAYLDRVGGGFVRRLDASERCLPLAERLNCLLTPRAQPAGYGLPVEILRAIIAQVPTRPEIGRDLVMRLAAANRRVVTEELDRAVADGALTRIDTSAAADLLLDMVRPWPVECLLDPTCIPDADGLSARRALAVSVFLGGVSAN
ncbi:MULTISPECIES: TetR/AcrR family transcriptional regulator [Meridianimarinicoccus]|uniref:TetR/AcrR family transcriptional regulator n=1 Tax=Meridianimarinicoccus zhengii TaxID=2056810 RepID=UPI000DACDAD4|nr:TetR/AcrR family transcriptional regulator [Phycocomes zhengii]